MCSTNYLTHTSAVIVVLLPIKSKAGKFNDIEAIWFTFGCQLNRHLVDLIRIINNNKYRRLGIRIFLRSKAYVITLCCAGSQNIVIKSALGVLVAKKAK